MTRRSLTLTALVLAGCGASYSPNSDLPFAAADLPAAQVTPQVCRPCTVDADCGPGGFCTAEPASQATFCTAACPANGDCGDGESCFPLGNDNTGCYPSDASCETILSTTGQTSSGSTGAATSNGAGSTSDTGSTSGESTTAVETTSGDVASSTAASTTGTSSTTSTDTATSTTSSTTGTTSATSSTTGTTSTTSANSSTTGAQSTSSTTGTSATSTTGTSSTSATSTTGTTTGGTTGSSCTPDSWATTMSGFFVNTCNSCHSHHHSFTQSTVKSSKATIISKMQSRSMPEGATLTTAQISAVVTWLDCGAP